MEKMVEVSVGMLVALGAFGGAGLVGLIVCFAGWLQAASGRDMAEYRARSLAESLARAKAESAEWFGKYMGSFGK